jgi:hypothetical protein
MKIWKQILSTQFQMYAGDGKSQFVGHLYNPVPDQRLLDHAPDTVMQLTDSNFLT